MTNNEFNEFENTDIDRMEQDQMPPRQSGFKANLSEAWRTRPLFKLLVLMIIVGAVVAASVSFFSSKNGSNEISKIVTPPDMHEAPGGPASPFVQQQTKLANEQRAQEAIDRNGSALPTPIGQSSDIGDLLNRNKNDPLNELRAQVMQLQKQQVQQQQTAQTTQQQQVQQQQQKPPEQFDDTLAQAMQRQMQQLTEGWQPKGVKQVTVVHAEDLKNEKSGADANASAADKANALAALPAARTIVPAGTVSYGQLLTEANSDVPGPILAQIVSGPLAGARAVGTFQTTNGYADYLVLSFSLVSLKGKDYQISAVALDPDTTLGGLATEVDQRYFTRVILPAAAGFLQGFGQALGQNSITTTTNGQFAITQQAKAGVQQGVFYGLGNAANTTSQFFQNQANLTKPLVRVAAGTPIGIFFVQSVKDQTNQPLSYGASGYGNQYNAGLGGLNNGLNGLNGFNGQNGANNPYAAAAAAGLANGASANPYGAAGYPGTTVSGYGAGATGSTYNPNSVPYPNYANQSYNGSTLNSPYSNLNITPGVGSYGYR